MLVAGQVALTVVVLAGAALLGRTLAQLQHTPLGFDPTDLVYFRVDNMVPRASIGPAFAVRRRTFIDRLPDLLRATPGLGPMTTSFDLPFSGRLGASTYILEGEAPNSTEHGPLVQVNHALDDYFGVMGIPLLRGRTLRRNDDPYAPPAMVVNEAFARLAWPGRDPIGRRVRFPTDSVERWWTVVGVVGDTRYTDPAKASEPAVYTSSRQGPWYDVWFVVRTSLDPRRAIGLLDRTIQTVDPGFGISEATTGAEQLSARLARPRALATLFSGLAGTALFLAALGLFGVLAAYVRERQREIAIRSALGATPRQLRTLVLVQTLAVTALGVCCGVPLALTGGHILRNMVRDVLPLDSLSLGLVGLILLGVVGLATYAPMVRATRVDARWALASE